ncbi:MAG: hypothetical protein MjAS7_1981 [Metallosphaera javensis (ex Sakai et al. 2022)]|nr:MAG: hypothetical protein MjAS7_1981 [Metallosphaera javensis (ex Sakai et al. 2022)]
MWGDYQFQTLKGSLQTPQILKQILPKTIRFQTLKGSLQTKTCPGCRANF